jgi:hypothetical protein
VNLPNPVDAEEGLRDNKIGSSTSPSLSPYIVNSSVKVLNFIIAQSYIGIQNHKSPVEY